MIGHSHDWTSARQTVAYGGLSGARHAIAPRSALLLRQAKFGLMGAGHNARVFDVAFSPADTSLLASASDDDTAKVWRMRDDQGSSVAAQHCSMRKGASASHSQLASFHGHEDSVLRVSWAPDGCMLATGPMPAQFLLAWHIPVCMALLAVNLVPF